MQSSYSSSESSTFDPRAFALKGGLFPLTLLELHNSDLGELRRELLLKARQAPAFFKQAPAVLSLDMVADQPALDIAAIKELCGEAGLIIVALRESTSALNAQARELNLAVLPKSRARTVGHQPAKISLPSDGTGDSAKRAEGRPGRVAKAGAESAANPDKIQPPPAEQPSIGREGATDIPVLTDTERYTKIITTPIRSGQQVYAAGGDLIVAASVSAGAELLADGNIHVYGALRGRALAGVKGNEKARIFCQSMEAELVSISGNFKSEENPSIEYRNKPVMIYLEDKILKVKPLASKNR